MTTASRVVVIGWDGADWEVLRPLIRQGALPNLARLMEQGASGPLMSTVPPVTTAAWTSIVSGVLPARHGLVNWQLPLNGELDRPWMNSRMCGVPRLWDWLSQAGRTCCVVGLPLSYPASPLKGAMLTGMMTPGLKGAFIHPPEWAEEFRDRFPDYIFDVDIQFTTRQVHTLEGMRSYVAALRRALTHRQTATRYLLDKQAYDCVFVVFETPDRVQHLLFPYAQAEPTTETPIDWDAGRQLVVELYTALDQALGDLLNSVDLAETTVLLVSDHGFQPLRRQFYLNNWLVDQGFMAYLARRVGLRELLSSAARPFRRWIPGGWIGRARRQFAWYRHCDWQRTVAYAGMSTEDGIWINLKGREPFGTVDPDEYDRVRTAVADALLQARDPLDGRPIVAHVWRREELYDGPFAERAPDLVYQLADGYRTAAERGRGAIVEDVTRSGEGIHRVEGVFLAAGAGVDPQGTLAEPARVVDVMPTVLALLGVPVPENLDGRVLAPIFPGIGIRYQGGAGQDEQGMGVGDDAYDERDREVIQERLRSLGYLD